MPTVASISVRWTGTADIQLEIGADVVRAPLAIGDGAVALPSLPTRSVLPRKRSCSVTPFCLASVERARSIRRGKSTCQRWGGVYGQWVKHSLHW